MIAGNARSGATWVPVYVSYGGNNRTQMLRIPGPGRIENRAIDGSCNPYLAAAALLAAGLDVIEWGLAAGPAEGRNMYELGVREREEAGIEVLPAALRDAVEALERDDVLCAALGDTYARTYISSKLEEWRSYHDAVAQWEIDRYLEAY